MSESKARSKADWQGLAARLHLDGRPVLAGARAEPSAAGVIDLVNPATARSLGTSARCERRDVDAAVYAARRALDVGVWDGLPVQSRSDVMRRWADLVEQHADELALLDTLQMGMPVALARDDVGLAARKLREAAASAERLQHSLLPGASTSLAMNLRAPQGVVAAITPWNFPLFVALAKLGPALVMGNAVVLKPSEWAPLACLRVADLATQAGLPPGVLSVLPGLGPEAGQALALHPDVDMLAFTGSTATGRHLMRAAADSNLKALQLELGGKSPQVVVDDLGDLDGLAQALADGLMFNSGQVCVAGSRLLVHRDLAPTLLPRVAEKMASWVFGDPLDPATTLGPLASAAHCQRVQGFIDRAHSQGFTAFASPAGGGAGFPTPLVFGGVPAQAEIAQEEVFGPVAACTPFETPDEAVALANGTRYGLVATVWCRDPVQGLALGRRLRAGAVTVNSRSRHDPVRALGASLEPVGQSGFGAEGGAAGLLAYTRARHLQLNLPS